MQVSAIDKSVRTVLYCACKSEEFIARTGAAEIMSAMGVPAVFPFSMSYHISIVNTPVFAGVSTFDSGYVHDNMIDGVQVGVEPITITRRPSNMYPNGEVVSIFGKSTYVEPFMMVRSVRSLHPLMAAMPDQ